MIACHSGPHDGSNLKNIIANRDIIIILATDDNLRELGWNFIESAYSAFGGSAQHAMNKELRAKKLKDLINYIKSDNKWMLTIKEQAKERKISVDSTLMLNAIYILEQQQ
jgi:hypothetical protein